MNLLNGDLIKAFPVPARNFIGYCVGILIVMIGLRLLFFGDISIDSAAVRPDTAPRIVLTGEAHSLPVRVPGAPMFLMKRMR